MVLFQYYIMINGIIYLHLCLSIIVDVHLRKTESEQNGTKSEQNGTIWHKRNNLLI